jgi:hypothetical protein
MILPVVNMDTKGYEKSSYNYHCYAWHYVKSATANTFGSDRLVLKINMLLFFVP